MGCIDIKGNIGNPLKYYTPSLDNTCVEVGAYNNFSGELVSLALANEAAIKRFILHKVKCVESANDIFQDALLMLSSQREDRLESISLRYVYGCVNIIIKRFNSEKVKTNNLMYIENEETLYESGMEIYSYTYEIEDDIEDELIGLMDSLEGDRYRYKHDLFLILYVNLLTKNDSRFYSIMRILCGINKKELYKLYRSIMTNRDVMRLFYLISNCKSPISRLEKYVYGSEEIKNVILRDEVVSA